MPEVSGPPPGERERSGRRAVPEVRQDCKAREAVQQERSRAHAGEPGSASSGAAVRSASCAPALAQTLSADTVEPGSASSSQAQVTPPASGRVAENAGARAASIAASDVRNMNKADLRTLATSLGVNTRPNKKKRGHSAGGVCSDSPRATWHYGLPPACRGLAKGLWSGPGRRCGGASL